MNECIVKSKNTKYNGYNFRSRLEARWAVFFDAIGIKYHYEYQDFTLRSGSRYLPDFYFPTFEGGCHGEVKHEFTSKEVVKCIDLCILTKKPVLLLEGVPDFKCIEYYEYYDGMEYDDYIDLQVGIPNASQARYEDRMFVQPGFYGLDIPDDSLDEFSEIINPVIESRSYRFEF